MIRIARNRAFTMVELLVVIIIIGMLLTIGITQYRRAVERAYGSQAKSMLNMIRKVEAVVYANTGLYSADLGVNSPLRQEDSHIAQEDAAWQYRVDLLANTCQIVATRKAGTYKDQTIVLHQDGAIDIPAGIPWQ